MRMKGVGIVQADSAADVDHIGFEAEEGIMVVVAGGTQIAAKEDVFLLVVAAEFGDTVATHGGLGDVEGGFKRPRFQSVHSSRFAGNGSKGEDAGEKERERENGCAIEKDIGNQMKQ